MEHRLKRSLEIMIVCDHDCVSVFFRVEDIFDGCCATLRVLEPLDSAQKRS